MYVFVRFVSQLVDPNIQASVGMFTFYMTTLFFAYFMMQSYCIYFGKFFASFH